MSKHKQAKKEEESQKKEAYLDQVLDFQAFSKSRKSSISNNEKYPSSLCTLKIVLMTEMPMVFQIKKGLKMVSKILKYVSLYDFLEDLDILFNKLYQCTFAIVSKSASTEA